MKNTLHTHLCQCASFVWSAIIGMCCFPLASLCVSPRFLCVVTATVTRESGGYRRKETRATDLDAIIFNSLAH